MNFRSIAAGLTAAASLFFMASDAEARRIQVLTSFLPVYCFTANVAGDLADVENILPAGVGPHSYQFSPKDLKRISSADVIVVNGLGLEDWLVKAIRKASPWKSPTFVEASAGLKKELIEFGHGIRPGDEPGSKKKGSHSHHDHHHHGPNPHIWLDPALAIHAVNNITKALQKADPANAAAYARNAAQYIERLKQLDADLARDLAPVQGKAFVTFHDAFPYFVRRYNLKLAGVIEEVPDVNPSPRYLHNLMNAIRETQAKVIFTEPQFSPRLAQTIARDLKITLAELDTLETGPFKPEAYEQGMRRNAAVLVEHLK